MSKRTRIPADLKRSVLIESGHRCAIPTCRATEIDIHHIDNHSKVKEHKFDNLIVLCPNCHRRVHNGYIDNMSLRMYKMNLRLNRCPNFILETFSQYRKIKPPHRVSIEYPVFNDRNQDYKTLNKMIKEYIDENKIDEQTPCEQDLEKEESLWATIDSEYISTFKSYFISEELLSIRFYYYWYGAGAAHGNYGVKCLNYFMNPLKEISLSDLFSDKECIHRISEFVIRYLLDEKHLKDGDEWIEVGASPEWTNYERFSINEDGIWIYFGPYQVGCFAEGEHEVLLSKRFLEPLINKQSVLYKIWFPYYFS